MEVHGEVDSRGVPEEVDDEATGLLQSTPRKTSVQHVNVIVLAIAFLLLFSSFSVIQSLASSTLPVDLAFVSLAVLYFVFGVSNLTVAAFIVERFGITATLFVSSLGYLVMAIAYLAAIAHEGDEWLQWMFILPASTLLGVAASVLWTAQGAYVGRCAAKDDVGKVSGLFFGVVNLQFLSPLLLSALVDAQVSIVTVFAVMALLCGLGCVVMAFIWARPEPGPVDVVVDRDGTSAATTSRPREVVGGISMSSLAKTAMLFWDSRMTLLIPLFVTTAMIQSFASGSLPLLVPPDLLSRKLYLISSMGFANMLTSFVVGHLTDRFSATRVFYANATVHSLLIVALALLPRPIDFTILIIVGLIHGASDATLINTGYSVLATVFSSDLLSAFSFYRFSVSLSTGLFFVSSRLLLQPDTQQPRMLIWAPVTVLAFTISVAGLFLQSKSAVAHTESTTD